MIQLLKMVSKKKKDNKKIQKTLRIDTKKCDIAELLASKRHQTFTGYVLSLIDKDINEFMKKIKKGDEVEELNLNDEEIEKAIAEDQPLPKF